MCQFEYLNFACAELMAALHAKSFENPWKTEEFKNLLKLSTTRGLICEKGMIVCSVCGEDAEILTLCVSPDFRRQGVAETMIRKMCEYIKNFQVVSLFLEVNVNNQAALKLYEKCGFQKAGVRKNYYKTTQGRQDALVLKKRI